MSLRTKFAGIIAAASMAVAVAVLAMTLTANDSGTAHAHGPDEAHGDAHGPNEVQSRVSNQPAGRPRALPDGVIPAEVVAIEVIEPSRADGAELTVALVESRDDVNMLYLDVTLDQEKPFVWSSRSDGAEHIPGSGLVLLEQDGEVHGWLEGPNYGVVGVEDASQLGEVELRARLMTVGGEPYVVDGVPVETLVRATIERR